MAQSEDRPPRGNRPPPAQDPNFNWRGVVLFAVAIALIGGAFLFRNDMTRWKEAPFPAFREMLEKKLVVLDDRLHPIELVSEPNSATDTLRYSARTGRPPTEIESYRTQVNLRFNQSLQKTLEEYQIVPDERAENNLAASMIVSFLPIMLFLLVLYFFFRQQIRMAGKGALNFGKSKARMLSREKNKITFKEVAGVEEAKEEVQEIVEFLKDPKKFQKLGGRIPKGVLMIGPPGTGKTLLARAIAGTASAAGTMSASRR